MYSGAHGLFLSPCLCEMPQRYVTGVVTDCRAFRVNINIELRVWFAPRERDRRRNTDVCLTGRRSETQRLQMCLCVCSCESSLPDGVRVFFACAGGAQGRK